MKKKQTLITEQYYRDFQLQVNKYMSRGWYAVIGTLIANENIFVIVLERDVVE